MTGVEPHLLLAADLDEPQVVPFCGGTAVVYTRRTPVRDRPNEDGALVLPLEGGRGVLAVADGAGGQTSGGRAAALALESLRQAGTGASLREDILTAIEQANARIAGLKVGAASTLVAIEMEGAALRSYHVGDSEVLLVGQRGKRKYQSISHAPVSYAVEAGILHEDEALHHDERHIVSNLLGADDIHIDMSARIEMAPRDTLLLGTDGLFDNVHRDEIVDLIRTGPIERVALRLRSLVRARMRGGSSQPSKPDDVTFVLFRRGRSAQAVADL